MPDSFMKDLLEQVATQADRVSDLADDAETVSVRVHGKARELSLTADNVAQADELSEVLRSIMDVSAWTSPETRLMTAGKLLARLCVDYALNPGTGDVLSDSSLILANVSLLLGVQSTLADMGEVDEDEDGISLSGADCWDEPELTAPDESDLDDDDIGDDVLDEDVPPEQDEPIHMEAGVAKSGLSVTPSPAGDQGRVAHSDDHDEPTDDEEREAVLALAALTVKSNDPVKFNRDGGHPQYDPECAHAVNGSQFFIRGKLAFTRVNGLWVPAT